MKINKAIATKCKKLRLKRGLSQRSLAGASDLSTATLGRVEHAGEGRLRKYTPRLGTVNKLARTFGIPLSMMVSGPTREIINLMKAAGKV